MTFDDIKAIRERADKATPAPWTLLTEVITKGIDVRGKTKVTAIANQSERATVVGLNWCTCGGEVWQAWLSGRPETFDFIASSRTDVPRLCKALEIALQALVRSTDQDRPDYGASAEAALNNIAAL